MHHPRAPGYGDCHVSGVLTFGLRARGDTLLPLAGGNRGDVLDRDTEKVRHVLLRQEVAVKTSDNDVINRLDAWGAILQRCGVPSADRVRGHDAHPCRELLACEAARLAGPLEVDELIADLTLA